jgi:elongation factor P hydroxylase
VSDTATVIDHVTLAGRFNARLGRRLGVLLIGGAAEPVYLPPTAARPAWIRYARDHAASVLHELAHWCHASAAARCREDYGLAYEPPPRDGAAQRRFYAAEVPVQALEKLLCEAVGLEFRCSDDNPGVALGPDRGEFEARVEAACDYLRRQGPDATTRAVRDAVTADWRPGRSDLLRSCT